MGDPVKVINLGIVIKEFEALGYSVYVSSNNSYTIKNETTELTVSFEGLISNLFRLKNSNIYDNYVRVKVEYNEALDNFLGGLSDEKYS